MAPISLADLHEDIIVLIASYLLPDWHLVTTQTDQMMTYWTRTDASRPLPRAFACTKDLPIVVDAYHEPKGSRPSLAALAKLNATCRKLHRLTLGMLWENVTLLPGYRWKGLSAEKGELVRSLWVYNDKFDPSNGKPSLELASTLPSRFPSAKIAIFFNRLDHGDDPASNGICLNLHLVLPASRVKDAWTWTSLREPIRALRHVHIRLPNDTTPGPRWMHKIVAGDISILYREPQTRFKLPFGIKLPVTMGQRAEAVVTWSCEDERDLSSFFQDLKQQIIAHTKPLQSGGGWAKMSLRASVTMKSESRPSVPAEAVEELTRLLRARFAKAMPNARATFELWDKPSGQHLFKICVGEREDPWM